MSTSSLVNSIGLLCDIVGAVLIWRYGLPEHISRTGAVHLIAEQTDETEKAKAKRYDRIRTVQHPSARRRVCVTAGQQFPMMVPSNQAREAGGACSSRKPLCR